MTEGFEVPKNDCVELVYRWKVNAPFEFFEWIGRLVEPVVSSKTSVVLNARVLQPVLGPASEVWELRLSLANLQSVGRLLDGEEAPSAQPPEDEKARSAQPEGAPVPPPDKRGRKERRSDERDEKVRTPSDLLWALVNIPARRGDKPPSAVAELLESNAPLYRAWDLRASPASAEPADAGES
jgi:hypothetical protein